MMEFMSLILSAIIWMASVEAGESQGQRAMKPVQKHELKEMDVIQNVNGHTADHPQKAMELYNQMKSEDVAYVDRREPRIDATSQLKDWNVLLSRATPQERQNLGKVLQQIRMVPAKHPTTGESVFKVMAVEKGSVFDREGVRPGDLLATGS